MPLLRFTSDALDNIADISHYIADESGSPVLAERFTDRLIQKCSQLASLPGTMGRERPELRPDIRSFVFKSYVIFFRYEGEALEVVNVLEGHRDIEAYFGEDEN
jgi:plasmid stabilization system protein ParE